MAYLRALGRPATFVLFVLAGLSVAYLVSTLRAGPTSDLKDPPQVVLDVAAGAPGEPGDVEVVAFDPGSEATEPIRAPNPAELTDAQDATGVQGSQAGDGGRAALNGTSFPRIRPVSQFDDGPFERANCTLAAGAMLAQLGFGIVTTPTLLRTLQRDQDGGTDLNDLAEALRRGYGKNIARGAITPTQLRTLLGKGFGVVLQGIYGRVPGAFSLQSTFAGPHAVYVDGYYRPTDGGADAFYVVDPLFKRGSRYDGQWWPGSIVDAFATALGGGRMYAAWAYPWDGSGPPPPPPDVPDLPRQPPAGEPQPDVDQGGDEGVDLPGRPTDDPDTTGPGGAQPPDDGDEDEAGFWVCVRLVRPVFCPHGFVGTLGTAEVSSVPKPGIGPPLEVSWMDVSSPNRALISFRTSATAAVGVSYWPVAGGDVREAHVASLVDPAQRIADLEVLAATDYEFRIAVIDGRLVTLGPISTLHTGPGVSRFEAQLATREPPVVTMRPGGFGPVLDLTVDPVVLLEPLPRCETARVLYATSGVAATSVVVRAYPLAAVPFLPDKIPRATLQNEGPGGRGELVLGCLTPDTAYRLTIDLSGDAAGELYSVIVPAER